MRSMSRINLRSRTQSLGFTLVEVVVIAPILILTLGGFVLALVTMVGDTLASRDTNMLVHDTQTTLTRIEQDVRLATGFQSTSGTVPSPQGQDLTYTGTSAFVAASTNHLIMSVPTTTLNPLDSNRAIVYYANKPNPCGPQQAYNTPLSATVVYYLNGTTLFRRTIIPTYTLTSGPNMVCAAPWQQNSCSPGYTSAQCQTQDIKLLDNVSSIDFSYYGDPTSTSSLGASNAASATTVSVTINTSKTSGGQPIAHTANLRATRINSTIAATSVPLAFTSQPQYTYAAIADTNITFTATAPYNPTYTWQRSTDNGATWTTIAGATSSTLTIPSVDMSWNQNRFRAVAVDQYGRVITSNTAILTVGLWGSFNYQNGWADYNPGNATYPGGQYTKTSAGLVMLRGLVASGTEAWDNTIATLPPEYRPSNRMMFYVGSYDASANRDSGFGRVDILPTGEVKLMTGSNTWIALDQIRFMANSATCSTSTDITPLLSGWVNYAGGYDNLSVCRTSSGLIASKGLVRSGTSTAGTQIGAMPAGYQSTEHRILPAADGQSASPSSRIFNSIGIYSYATGFVARGKLVNYLSANNIYAANNGAVTWQTPTVNGGWVHYGGSFATLQYGKTSDNVVMLKGLIKDGATADNTILFRLPAGYHPSKRILSSGVAYNSVAPNMAHARIDVEPDGDVVLHSGANATWTSFDAISFYADGS